MKADVFPNASLEKNAKPSRPSQPAVWLHWRRTAFICITIVFTARWYFAHGPVLGCGRLQKVPASISDNEGLTEPWNRITPSKELVFHECFGHHQCARLSVPMDWNSTDPGSPRVNLAITRLPARVPVTDPRYGGLLWLQTGGPGSSGVNFLLRQGKTAQMIVDSPLDPLDDDYDEADPPKYFDVLGFDPRGVNNTTPRLMCFPDATSRDLWILQSSAEGILGSSGGALADMWARSTALSEGCSHRIAESDNPGDKLAFHMNTSPVVADIVAVIEQYGNWREEKAVDILSAQNFHVPANHYEPVINHPREKSQAVMEILERTAWKKGEEKIMYWGLSYGTILGATFAAMQPHRIERAIIDGVAHSPDYYRGEWLTNLQDTDILLDKFGKYCNEAGPRKCALYLEGGARVITQNFKGIVESLKNNPIGVPAQGDLAPDLITYSDVRREIREAVYAPIQLFPPLATHLSDLATGNGTSFAITKQAGSPLTSLPKHCRNAAPYSPECAGPANLQGETSRAILCSDGNGTFGMTKDAYAEYVAELREQSWLIGDTWAEIRLGCVGWSIEPKWRYPGPFGGQTAKPMLIVGTRNDPVTPIRNAYAMAERFPGSTILEVDAEGHCMMSSPSLCMARHVRAYFQSGALPESGTVCDDNEKPFIGVTKRGEAEEEELLEQLRWTASHLYMT